MPDQWKSITRTPRGHGIWSPHPTAWSRIENFKTNHIIRRWIHLQKVRYFRGSKIYFYKENFEELNIFFSTILNCRKNYSKVINFQILWSHFQMQIKFRRILFYTWEIYQKSQQNQQRFGWNLSKHWKRLIQPYFEWQFKMINIWWVIPSGMDNQENAVSSFPRVNKKL